MIRLARWVYIVSFILLSGLATAQIGSSQTLPVSPIDLEGPETVYSNWDGYLIPITDRSEVPSWEQVTQLLSEKAVRARDDASLRGNSAYQNGYGWVAMPFRNASDKRKDFKLDSREAYILSDNTFLLRPGEPPVSLLRGANVLLNSFDERFPSDRFVSMDWMSLDVGETVIVMIPTTHFPRRSESWYAVTAEGFSKGRSQEIAIISAGFAFRVAFTVIVFAFAIILRSRTAALYGLLAIALSAYMAGEFGLLYATVLPNPDHDYLYNELSILAISLIYSLTTRSFFDLPRTQPRAMRLIYVCLIALVVFMPVGYFFPSFALPVRIFDLYFAQDMAVTFTLVMYGLNLWCTAQALRRRSSGALLYLFGGIILFIVMNDAALVRIPGAWVEATDHYRNALLSFDIVVFVAALVMQTLSLRRDRDLALSAKLDVQNQLITAYSEKDAAQRVARRHKEALENTSHDLRQPLTSLRLAIQSSKDSDIHLKRKLEAGLDYLVGVLTPVATEEPDNRPAEESVPVQVLCDNLERMFSDQAAGKGLTLKVRASALEIRVDPVGVTRALSNLVANAIEYTESGKILVAARQRGDKMDLQVWDTGVGLTSDQRDRVVQRGERGADAEAGRGLGLASTDTWARENGLRLTVSSQEGRGSVFAIEGVPVLST